jgi:hypothetical protein
MSTLVVIGTQFGDEGKGKIVDYLSEKFDIVVRFQGGNNAGHTVVVGNETYKFHILPSGVVREKTVVLGNGIVIDPKVLLNEMEELKKQGINYELKISGRAHVILPYHINEDILEEKLKGKQMTGTTKKGIGPTYKDKFARFGIRMIDLLDKNILKKEFSVKHDTIRIDSVSISPYYFKVYNADDRLIGPELYSVDFARAELILDPSVKNFNKKIYVEYQPLPEFLTRQYKVLDRDLITEKTSDLTALYNPNKVKRNKNIKLFDGLYTSGNLSRGITVGNNQDAVVNSDFNLQIQGNLSENIGIRASITDNNVPLQEGGYTQRIDEFDRVFIELFSKNWKINAGDVYLQNNQN